MEFKDLIHAKLFQVGLVAAGITGAAAFRPEEAEADETYREYATRKGSEDAAAARAGVEMVTYYDEDKRTWRTLPLEEYPVPLERGPVSNADFYLQAMLRTEAGVPITDAFSDGTGSYARLTLTPEVQLYLFGANADLNVAEAKVSYPGWFGDGENRFHIDALEEVNFRANILGGALYDALVPRAIEADNDLRLAAEVKWDAQAGQWLPGLSTRFTLVPEGPFGTIVSLDASLHLDPELLKEGTYLPQRAEIKLQDGWYLGPATGSLQMDIVGELGVRAEVVRQAPEAPLRDLDERVSSEFFGGASITIRGAAPQDKKPQR